MEYCYTKLKGRFVANLIWLIIVLFMQKKVFVALFKR